MKSNENIFVESFIFESEKLSETQILDKFQKMSESCKKLLLESFKGKELNVDNYNEVYNGVNKFINEVEKQIEEIHDMSKNMKTIEKLNGFIESAKGIKRKLEKDIVREAVKLPPILKGNLDDAMNKGDK